MYFVFWAQHGYACVNTYSFGVLILLTRPAVMVAATQITFNIKPSHFYLSVPESTRIIYSIVMKQYHDLMARVMSEGVDRSDRTGVGTRGVFGHQMRFNLADGFPMLTTKKLHLKSIVHELIWFLTGDTNIKYLQDNGVKIWDAWADENGELGPVYGKQWRKWETPDGRVIDQMSNVIEAIKTNPYSRRHIVTAWNPAEVDDMALPPCHCLFQFHVANGKLSCQLYQRSADVFLGVPFNIASYALLTHMVADACGLEAGDFVHSFGDVHIYANHFEQVKLQLTREPRPLPKLTLSSGVQSLYDYNFDDIKITGYKPYPHIAGKVAV